MTVEATVIAGCVILYGVCTVGIALWWWLDAE